MDVCRWCIARRRASSPERYGYAAYVAPSHESFSKNLSSTVTDVPELHHAVAANSGILSDPRSIAEAIDTSRPDAHLWQMAIDNEFQSLIDKGVYSETLLPPGPRVLVLLVRSRCW